MLTINKIKRKLEEIQQAHGQLNDFYFGDFSALGADRAINYNLLLAADLLPGSLRKNVITTRLTLAVAGRVKHDDSDKTEVLSDTQRVIIDVITQLYQYLQINNVELSKEVTLSDFSERWNDSVSGFQAEITINQFNNENLCEIPSTFDPQTAPGEFIVYDQSGNILYRFYTGQSMTVLVFSGIVDNGPPYTNSIVDNG